MPLSQQQKEELNNEFYTWSMKVREISALTGEETANWWLSKFDQLIQEKRDKIKKALLLKARQTDYADRTEYDEACEVVETILKE